MKLFEGSAISLKRLSDRGKLVMIGIHVRIDCVRRNMQERLLLCNSGEHERGDVPGWVLVVLMTTGLVTAIWTIAAPRLTAILRNSLDSMNGIR